MFLVYLLMPEVRACVGAEEEGAILPVGGTTGIVGTPGDRKRQYSFIIFCHSTHFFKANGCIMSIGKIQFI